MTRSSHRRKRRYRKFEEIKEIVDQFDRSKLTQRAFAQAQKIPLATLTHWLRRVRSASTQATPTPAELPLIEVQRPTDHSTPSMCIVEFANGHRLFFPSDTDSTKYRDLINTLAQLSCSR